MFNPYLQETPLLDYNHNSIFALIRRRNWEKMDQREQILQIYNFVRDEIRFGYNCRDTIPASQILAEGYGQCNTKSILLMAILRSLGIKTRLHGFTIDKKMQKGVMTGELYEVMPDEIVHTWPEVFFEERWYCLEGIILDLPFLSALQARFSSQARNFLGYAVGTKDLNDPQVFWEGNNDTFIQKEGIVKDFGVYDSPDSFYKEHPQNMGCELQRQFSEKLRHIANNNIVTLRGSF